MTILAVKTNHKSGCDKKTILNASNYDCVIDIS